MKPKDKGFEQAPLVDCIVTIVGKPQGYPCTNWVGIIDIDRLPYRTARYKDKDCAISELVGFLEGLKIQIDADLEFLRKSLDV